jgi:hypothetical protein
MMTLQSALVNSQDPRKPAQNAAAQVWFAPKGDRTCAMSALGPLPHRSKPAQLEQPAAGATLPAAAWADLTMAILPAESMPAEMVMVAEHDEQSSPARRQ